MRAIHLSILPLLFASSLAAQEMKQDLKKEYIDPVEATASSTIVKVKGGSLLFLAGHTASQPDRNADLGNFDTQAKITMNKIKATLDKAGGSFDDIVSLSVYVTDLRYVPQFTKLAKELFKNGYPATTFVEVVHLARPESLLEIQPIAVLK